MGLLIQMFQLPYVTTNHFVYFFSNHLLLVISEITQSNICIQKMSLIFDLNITFCFRKNVHKSKYSGLYHLQKYLYRKGYNSYMKSSYSFGRSIIRNLVSQIWRFLWQLQWRRTHKKTCNGKIIHIKIFGSTGWVLNAK